MSIEYRAYDLAGVNTDKEKRTITGRAVPYGSMSSELRLPNGDMVREVIMPGSATESMKGDIMALVQHNNQMILGRTSSGTLALEDRADGLYATINVPETTYGNDLLVSAARGDVKGFSFGFSSPKGKNYSRAGQKIREINSFNLREVSVVTNPAYESTTLSLRSEDFVAEEKPVVVADHKNEIEVMKLKLRLIEINEQN